MVIQLADIRGSEVLLSQSIEQEAPLGNYVISPWLDSQQNFL